jgi:hypothetical protein
MCIRDRDDGALLGRGASIVALTKLHDVDPVLAQGWTHRGRRIGLPRGELQFNLGDYLLGHLKLLAIGIKL